MFGVGREEEYWGSVDECLGEGACTTFDALAEGVAVHLCAHEWPVFKTDIDAFPLHIANPNCCIQTRPSIANLNCPIHHARTENEAKTMHATSPPTALASASALQFFFT